MNQYSLFDLEADTPTPRVCVYTGYSFGMIEQLGGCDFASLLSGIVVTPRWVDRLARDFELDAHG